VQFLGLRGAGIVGMICVPIEALTFVWLSTLDTLPGVAVLTPIFAAIFFATSIYTYAVNNSRFRWCSKEQAATDFSMQSSIWNFGGWAAGSVAGFVAAWFGYTIFFVIGAVIATAVAAWYVLLVKHVEPMVVQREADELRGAAISEAAQRLH
jgi:predicted MFS family arabinose efflux permease